METLKKVFEIIKFVLFPAINVTGAVLEPIFAAAGASVGVITLMIVVITANALHLGYKLFGKKQ